MPYPLAPLSQSCSPIPHLSGPIPAVLYIFSHPCNHLPAPLSLQSLSLLLHPCSSIPVFPYTTCMPFSPAPLHQSSSPIPHLCRPHPCTLTAVCLFSHPCNPFATSLSMHPSTPVLPFLLPYPSLLSLPLCPCSQIILATPFLLLCASISVPATPFLFPSLLPYPCSSSLFLIHAQDCEK